MLWWWYSQQQSAVAAASPGTTTTGTTGTTTTAPAGVSTANSILPILNTYIANSGVSNTFIYSSQSPDVWNYYLMKAVPGFVAPNDSQLFPGSANPQTPVTFQAWWNAMLPFLPTLPAGMAGLMGLRGLTRNLTPWQTTWGWIQ